MVAYDCHRSTWDVEAGLEFKHKREVGLGKKAMFSKSWLKRSPKQQKAQTDRFKTQGPTQRNPHQQPSREPLQKENPIPYKQHMVQMPDFLDSLATAPSHPFGQVALGVFLRIFGRGSCLLGNSVICFLKVFGPLEASRL